jgi:hypothetical protein
MSPAGVNNTPGRAVGLGHEEGPQLVGPGQALVEQPGHLQHALHAGPVALLAHLVEEAFGEPPQHIPEQAVAAVHDAVEGGPADRELVRERVHVDGGVLQEVLARPFAHLLRRDHAPGRARGTCSARPLELPGLGHAGDAHRAPAPCRPDTAHQARRPARQCLTFTRR